MHIRHLPATLALSALTLTGCGGAVDAEKDSASTVEPSVMDPSSGTTSEAPTSSTPQTEHAEPPPEAQANTKEGAEAFAEWYWGANGEVAVTSDTRFLEQYSAPDCRVCRANIEQRRDTAQKYGAADSNPYRVSVMRSAADGDLHRVKLSVDFDRYEYKKGGKVRAFVEADQYEVNLELRHDDGWSVQDWLMVEI